MSRRSQIRKWICKDGGMFLFTDCCRKLSGGKTLKAGVKVL
jgi:hypothetical protein